jgi:Flp pilus assembly protein TadD
VNMEDFKNQCLDSRVITDEQGVQDFASTSVHVETSNVEHSMVSVPSFTQSTPCSHARRFNIDRKQFANFVYFALAAAAMCDFLVVWRVPLLAPVVAIFALFGFAGYIFSLGITHHFEPKVALCPSTRRMLRIAALVIPIPFLIFGAMDVAAREEIKTGDRAYYDANNYADGVVHYGNAARLSPNLAEAYEGLAACYCYLGDSNKTIENADKAISLDPETAYSWSNKAWAELSLNPQSLDAVKSAEMAIKLDNTNGQAYSVIAEVLLNTGSYEKALAAADKHVNNHRTEPHAYAIRAQILEKLGRFDEAAADRVVSTRLPQ